MQMLREKIMESTEFKEYAEKHGMQGDENMAFRELYRDLRKSNETNKIKSREGRNKKRLEERGRETVCSFSSTVIISPTR